MANGIMYEFEKKYWAQNKEIFGIDEAGRGPLCGPLVVCGVSLPKEYINDEINDSKKLSAKKRKELFKEIILNAHSYKITIVQPAEIDRLNIYRATKFAMQEMADDFNGVILTDCMPLDNCEHESLVKGDSRSISIAAASIMAKVIRDHIMIGYDVLYPQYGFARHKGYATKQHVQNIYKYGVLPIYRRSFQPIKTICHKEMLNSLDI